MRAPGGSGGPRGPWAGPPRSGNGRAILPSSSTNVRRRSEGIAMGQKVHPTGFRLGYIKSWKSRWFATRAYADQLHEDLKIRRYLKERLYHAGISRIEFERKANQVRIIVHASRPGIIIGRKGAEGDKLRQELAGMTREGVKVMVSGRLAGAEIARTEWYREGRVPLHTLRANIDFGLAEARTTYGRIGGKAWIFHGEGPPRPG